jgi:DNA-binding LacI/PurR family transcriptional regulator
MAGQPTIEEVARKAGVSRGTASRVINGAPHVSPTARERVLRAIDDLRFVPNRAARSLVTQKHETVALAISGTDTQHFAEHPFFSEVVIGIGAALAEADLELLLVLGATARNVEQLRRRLSSHRVDGVMLLSLHGNDPLYAVVDESDVPSVVGGKPLGIEPEYYVDADNRGGARQAVEYLVHSGRTRIATITGPLDMDVGVARYDGFRDAMTAAGLPANRVAHGDFGQESAVRAMTGLLSEFPDLDAVFAASDSMASVILNVLRDHGRRVPEDVAVIGFDDRPLGQHTSPPLTTVQQPIRSLGFEMARMLIALIKGDSVSSQILATKLVIRKSA